MNCSTKWKNHDRLACGKPIQVVISAQAFCNNGQGLQTVLDFVEIGIIPIFCEFHDISRFQ